MKKVIGLVVAVSIVAMGWTLLKPAEVDAIGCIRCMPGYSYTSAEWGMGSSCAQADNNAIGLASSKINCNTCSETPEVVTPCYWDSQAQEYHSDWRIKYKCELNLCM